MWKSIADKLRIAASLSFVEWFYLSIAWWMLLWHFLYLKWGRFDLLSPSAVPELKDTHFMPFAQRLHRLVELASRLHLLPMTCLPRALTLQRMLVWRDIPSTLYIGVARVSAGVQAHAWVEVAGVPMGEAEDVRKKFNVLEYISNYHGYTFTP